MCFQKQKTVGDKKGTSKKGKVIKGEASEKGARIKPEIDKELLDKIEKASLAVSVVGKIVYNAV